MNLALQSSPPWISGTPVIDCATNIKCKRGKIDKDFDGPIFMDGTQCAINKVSVINNKNLPVTYFLN